MFNFLVVLAIVTRLVLMPISAHADLFFINAFPTLLISQNVLDIYSYFGQNLADRQYDYYPPLTYYTFGFFQFIYQFFSSTFSPWMHQLFELQVSTFQGQAADFIKAAPNANIFKDLFLAKVPYLIFDLAAVFVILKAAKKRLLKKTAVLVWLFNPVSFYAIYMIGQFEIIPTFFVLVGFLMLRKNPNLGILALGIAAALKNYAFLFILPTILVYENSWRSRAKLFAIAVAPYLIFILPTIISNAKEAIYVLFPKVYLHYRKPLEGWPLYSQLIKYAILATALATIFILSSVLKLKDKWRTTIGISLATVLLLFAFAPRISFHYLLWAAPLVIIWFRNIKLVAVIIIVQAVSLASYKLLANHLQAGLFTPLNPSYFSTLPTINSLVDKIFPYYIVSATGFFIFFFLNLYLILTILIDLIFKSKARTVKGLS